MIANHQSDWAKSRASPHFRLVSYIRSSPSSELPLISFIRNWIRHHAAAITLHDSSVPAASHEVYSDINHIHPNCKCNMLQATSTLSHSIPIAVKKPTLSFLVARLLEILLSLPLHLLILLLLVLLHSSRRPRAAVIRPRNALVLLRQCDFDFRQDFD